MRVLRALLVALGVTAVLFVMLDSGAVSADPIPGSMSVSLGVLAALFAAGAWGMQVGGRHERVPLLAGLAAGVGSYALLRLLLP